MTKLLWLDDERDPADVRWHPFFPIQAPEVIWVKSYAEFTDWITTNSLPDAICFDHDLGDGPSGMDAAKWLTEFCLDTNAQLPAWNIQSANPIGKMNIEALLTSFARVVDEPQNWNTRVIANRIGGFEAGSSIKQFSFSCHPVALKEKT